MLQKVSTPDGEKWAIVFNRGHDFQYFNELQKSLIDIISVSMESDNFCSLQYRYFSVFPLLISMMEISEDLPGYEAFMKVVNK